MPSRCSTTTVSTWAWPTSCASSSGASSRAASSQNANGTDHGSQGPMFVIGGAVKGGVYGNHPNINQAALNDDGNTTYSQAAGDPFRSTDFRDVYGTILKQWLGVADPWPSYRSTAVIRTSTGRRPTSISGSSEPEAADAIRTALRSTNVRRTFATTSARCEDSTHLRSCGACWCAICQSIST